MRHPTAYPMLIGGGRRVVQAGRGLGARTRLFERNRVPARRVRQTKESVPKGAAVVDRAKAEILNQLLTRNCRRLVRPLSAR